MGKNGRSDDRAIDVRFGSKMDDSIDVVIGTGDLKLFEVTDIALYKGVVWVVGNIFEVFEIASVSEFVIIDKVILGMVCEPIMNEIGTNKAGAAGNEDVHSKVFNLYEFSVIPYGHRFAEVFADFDMALKLWIVLRV